ncbi:unnamed protein product [Miscanthus lutarioriparius]|uniref:Uncharacterized protein n=1 Tax=Miscanthus lutarioriparius TaxID=422564 RepID=A0A811S415_9POAL|nr:unnamed protein product [Miscanthus lutarioriparius]
MAATMLAVALAVALAAVDVSAAPRSIHSAAPWERVDEEVRQLYEAWKSKHPPWPPRGNDDDLLRLEVFRDNLRYIDTHNAEADLGLHGFRLGLTPFADLTLEEFRGRVLGFQQSRRNDTTADDATDGRSTRFDLNSAGEPQPVPAAVDWRKSGAVTRVRNQSTCGGCWAFSAVAAMEGINKIVTGKLVELSEQELIDCDHKSHGCSGGRMDYAFQWVISNGGIDTEADYPFTGRDGTCDANKIKKKVVSISSYKRVLPANNEKALQAAVAHQPVSVAIEAGGRSFQHYKSGVFDGVCGTKLDHGVTAVGYGSENGKDYWIVKNSWGTRWGEAGYIRMRRNVAAPTGKCGIAMDTYYPVKNRPRAYRTAQSALELEMVLA